MMNNKLYGTGNEIQPAAIHNRSSGFSGRLSQAMLFQAVAATAASCISHTSGDIRHEQLR